MGADDLGALPTPVILYRSDTLVAVDKPSGILVHGDGTGAPTLTDAVRALLAQDDAPSPAHELQALQRLDRETSGIVLFSRAKRTQPAYDRMIAARKVDKRYLAIVSGRVPWRTRTLEGPIGRDRHDAGRMRVSRTGKPARTHVRVCAHRSFRGLNLTLLEVRIETGRKHQIRVHLAHEGLPLVGDARYGGIMLDGQAAGLMLHAARLSFTDPVTGAAIDITAPAPARMRALFRELR